MKFPHIANRFFLSVAAAVTSAGAESSATVRRRVLDVARPLGAPVSKKPGSGTYFISGHNLAWMKP